MGSGPLGAVGCRPWALSPGGRGVSSVGSGCFRTTGCHLWALVPWGLRGVVCGLWAVLASLLLVFQRHHGQREAERRPVPAALVQDVPGPCPHGRLDVPCGAPPQRPASGGCLWVTPTLPCGAASSGPGPREQPRVTSRMVRRTPLARPSSWEGLQGEAGSPSLALYELYI